MPIELINGANGHGKGQLAIKRILEFQQKNDVREREGKPRRVIYCNIHGVNSPECKPLKDVQPIPEGKIWFGKQNDEKRPPPPDFFIPPIGAIFIYDECQRIDWIKQKAGALSSDLRIISMEEHRHAGLDIILICQGANYVHTHLHDLISPHYYCERPLKMDITNVFKFNKYQKSFTPTTLKRADDHFVLKLGKKYGQYYKSSEEHNMKAEYPLKMKIAIGVLALCIIVTVFMFSRSMFFKDEPEVLPESKPDRISVQDDKIENPYQNPVATVSPSETPVELMQKYLPEYVAETAYYEDVRAAMVISSSSSCKAYNTYGERLNISQSDCMMMSDNPSFIPRSRRKRIEYDRSNMQDDVSDVVSVNPVPMSES